MILIIDHKETHVSYANNTLCIRRAKEKLQRIPLNLLEQLIVYGNPDIEMSVWRALSKSSIPSTLLSHRGSQEPAMLGSGLAVRLPLRRLQFRCAEQKHSAINIARWIVEQKFAGYNLLLSCFKHEQQERFRQQRTKITQTLKDVETIEQIMGLEGALALAWFSLLNHTLDKKWRFSGRNRRPPLDPFNALLSLSYTLLMSDIRQVLISEGLDPAFGFLHQDLPGREALVLDFTELFRGTVDFSVYSYIEQLSPEDFSYSEYHGCRLTKKARPQFYQFWAEFREQCPKIQTTNNGIISFNPLTEQIRGKIITFRDVLKGQEENNND